MESSSRFKRSWCCPKLPHFIHLFSPSPAFYMSNFCRAALLTVDISHFDLLVPCFLSVYSQLALLASVTGTGGNFSKTGAGGGSQSPAAGPDPMPDGLRVDTGPSEEEVQLWSGRHKYGLD